MCGHNEETIFFFFVQHQIGTPGGSVDPIDLADFLKYFKATYAALYQLQKAYPLKLEEQPAAAVARLLQRSGILRKGVDRLARTVLPPEARLELEGITRENPFNLYWKALGGIFIVSVLLTGGEISGNLEVPGAKGAVQAKTPSLVDALGRLRDIFQGKPLPTPVQPPNSTADKSGGQKESTPSQEADHRKAAKKQLPPPRKGPAAKR